MLVIGIDPDIDKSGVATICQATKSVELQTLPFFDLIEYIDKNRDKIKVVRIECGYLNAKKNWHSNKNLSIAAKIGAAVGSNEQISRLLVDYCKRSGVTYQEVKPLRKVWRSGKISHKELVSICRHPLPKRTNQEQRDALLLILN